MLIFLLCVFFFQGRSLVCDAMESFSDTTESVFLARDKTYSVNFSEQLDIDALDVHYKNETFFSEEVTVATLYTHGMTPILPELYCSMNLLTSTSVDGYQLKPLVAAPRLRFHLNQAAGLLEVVAPAVVLPSRAVMDASIELYNGRQRRQFLGVLRYPESTSVAALDFTIENIRRESEPPAFATNAIAKIESTAKDGSLTVSIHVELYLDRLGMSILHSKPSPRAIVRFYSVQALQHIAKDIWNTLLTTSGKAITVNDKGVYIEDSHNVGATVDLLSEDDPQLIFIEFDSPSSQLQEIC